MVEFDFEKFKRTCNNFENIIDLTNNREKRLFISAIYANGGECTPLVYGPNGSYAFWRTYSADTGKDVIYGVRQADVTSDHTIYTVQDFIIQKFDPSAVLEFLKE